MLDSAIDHVVKWAKGGKAAPTAPRLTRDPNAPTIPGLGLAQGTTFLGYAVDSHGQTLGGIQLGPSGG